MYGDGLGYLSGDIQHNKFAATTVYMWILSFTNQQTSGDSIQIVTGVEVITENCFPEICKMFPQGQRPRETFYEPRANNF